MVSELSERDKEVTDQLKKLDDELNKIYGIYMFIPLYDEHDSFNDSVYIMQRDIQDIIEYISSKK